MSNNKAKEMVDLQWLQLCSCWWDGFVLARLRIVTPSVDVYKTRYIYNNLVLKWDRYFSVQNRLKLLALLPRATPLNNRRKIWCSKGESSQPLTCSMMLYVPTPDSWGHLVLRLPSKFKLKKQKENFLRRHVSLSSYLPLSFSLQHPRYSLKACATRDAYIRVLRER